MADYPILSSFVSTYLAKVDGGWGLFKVVATFSHVGRSFDLFMATTGDVSNLQWQVILIGAFTFFGFLF